MAKILIVLRHEFITIVGKWSFWFALFGMPVFIGVIIAITVIGSGAATAAAIASRQNRAEIQGVVDHSGLLRILPAESGLTPYADDAAARAALEAGQVAGYFVVPADYIATGNVTYLSRQFSPLDSPTDPFEQAMKLNLAGGDKRLAQRVQTPVILKSSQSLAPRQAPGGSGASFPVLPIFAAVMFCIVLLTASSYLMQSVTTEKETRVMEVLMSSVTPLQLLAGKVLGLGLVGLVQLAVWLVSALSALAFIPPSVALGSVPAGVIVLAIVFFLLGYFIYASLMAGLGALMPGSREAAQYTFFIILPLIIPLYLTSAISLEPNSGLAVILSIFPLTSPVTMIMRIVATDVPAWHILLSLALLAATGAGVIWAVARVFRAQSLLSGSKPTLRQMLAALR